MSHPTHILTVVTQDRIGIIAGITRVLDEAGARLMELSQTVVRDYFTIILAISLPKGGNTQTLDANIRQRIGSNVAVTFVRYESAGQSPQKGEHYVLTATGIDHPGFVPTITEIIAEHGGNITDLSTRVIDNYLSMMAEIELPADLLLDRLQSALQVAGANIDLKVRLQHNRLFIATNEIAFRRVIHGTR